MTNDKKYTMKKTCSSETEETKMSEVEGGGIVEP